MFKWRPILRGICSLQEYDLHYSLKDLCDANEALDIVDEHAEWEQEQQEKELARIRANNG